MYLGSLSYCRRNNSTQSWLRQIRHDRQDAIALDYCAMHVWFNKLKWSDFFCVSMWTTYQLRPNKYLTKSAQSLYYTILAHFNTLVSASIVQFTHDFTDWSHQTSSLHPCGRHINSNLGYVICSSYDTTLLSHGQMNNCLIRTHLVLVLCDISVI